MRSEIYLSLEKAGEKSYGLNLTMALVVILALNAGLFGWYSMAGLPSHAAPRAMDLILAANLSTSAFLSLTALYRLPRIFNNVRDNLLLALSFAFLLSFIVLKGHGLFPGLGSYQLAAMFMAFVTMLVVPLSVVASTEHGVAVNLVLSLHERI
ncbi:MAG: hypothetical protein MUE79_00125 [Nitratireductor sp.]|nr:hypothetical protein [Nitratireductor sp.]